MVPRTPPLRKPTVSKGTSVPAVVSEPFPQKTYGPGNYVPSIAPRTPPLRKPTVSKGTSVPAVVSEPFPSPNLPSSEPYFFNYL
jgi:hypothetical protein